MSMAYTLSIAEYKGGFPIKILLSGVDYYRDIDWEVWEDFDVPYLDNGDINIAQLAYEISCFDAEQSPLDGLTSIFGWMGVEGVFQPYAAELIHECLVSFLDEDLT